MIRFVTLAILAALSVGLLVLGAVSEVHPVHWDRSRGTEESIAGAPFEFVIQRTRNMPERWAHLVVSDFHATLLLCDACEPPTSLARAVGVQAMLVGNRYHLARLQVGMSWEARKRKAKITAYEFDDEFWRQLGQLRNATSLTLDMLLGDDMFMFRRTTSAPRQIVVRIPLWLPAAILAAYPTLAFIRGPVRRWRRRKRGLCVYCGYNLTGLPEPRCPECGEGI